MRKKFSEVPERELKWKKYDYLRNIDFPTFYACECGKIYSNFPAIYLHFERKHKKKIHNLHETSQFQKIMNKSETIYLFFLRKGKTKNANEQQQTFLKSLNQIMNEFQRQCSNLQVIHENSLMTAKLFLNFIQFIYELQIRKSKQIPDLRSLLSQLPNKLNSFVESTFCEYKGEEQFKKICRILFQFSNWLNNKKYTQLIIQMCIMNGIDTTVENNKKQDQ